MTRIDNVPSAPTSSSSRPAARRRILRCAGVAYAAIVTVAVWGIGRLAGADYVLGGPSGSVVIDATTTAVVTLVVATLGWVALAVLERLTRHAGRIWAGLAGVVVTASMVPIFLVDATPSTQVALFFVHLAVAVLIPLLLRARSA